MVLENNLSALVVESLPLSVERSLRDLGRVREVGRAAQRAFFFVSPEDALNEVAASSRAIRIASLCFETHRR